MRIDQGLALSLAGMVGAGLARGDDELARARASLVAIGIMLRNADDTVAEVLSLSDRVTVTTRKGVTTIKLDETEEVEPAA